MICPLLQQELNAKRTATVREERRKVLESKGLRQRQKEEEEMRWKQWRRQNWIVTHGPSVQRKLKEPSC